VKLSQQEKLSEDEKSLLQKWDPKSGQCRVVDGGGGGGEGGWRGMAFEAHDSFMVLTFAKDETVTSTPPPLHHGTLRSYQTMRKRILGGNLAPASCRSMSGDGVEYARAPGMQRE
jgi:hypothetical protein